MDDLLHPEDSWIREYLNLELPPNKVDIALEVFSGVCGRIYG